MAMTWAQKDDRRSARRQGNHAIVNLQTIRQWMKARDDWRALRANLVVRGAGYEDSAVVHCEEQAQACESNIAECLLWLKRNARAAFHWAILSRNEEVAS